MHLKTPILATLFLATAVLSARAQTEAIDALPVSAIFVVSSGMWEEQNLEPVKGADGQLRPPPAAPTRGYYKVVAIRQGTVPRRSTCSASSLPPTAPISSKMSNWKSSTR